MVTFVMQLAGIKYESFDAYLVKFKENLSCVLKLWPFYQKSHVL